MSKKRNGRTSGAWGTSISRIIIHFQILVLKWKNIKLSSYRNITPVVYKQVSFYKREISKKLLLQTSVWYSLLLGSWKLGIVLKQFHKKCEPLLTGCSDNLLGQILQNLASTSSALPKNIEFKFIILFNSSKIFPHNSPSKSGRSLFLALLKYSKTKWLVKDTWNCFISLRK